MHSHAAGNMKPLYGRLNSRARSDGCVKFWRCMLVYVTWFSLQLQGVQIGAAVLVVAQEACKTLQRDTPRACPRTFVRYTCLAAYNNYPTMTNSPPVKRQIELGTCIGRGRSQGGTTPLLQR